MRLYAVGFLLLVGAIFMPQERYPGGAEPFPGPGSIAFPGGVAETETGTTSPYTDATAVWTFNDVNGLGFEGNDQYSGYATDFVAASSQYATIADNASLSMDGSSDIAVCAWTLVASGPANAGMVSKYDSGGDREYLLYDGTNARQLQFAVIASVTGFVQDSSLPETMSTGDRALACGWHDVSASTVHATWNDTAFTSGTTANGAIADGTASFNIGAWSDPTNYSDNVIGPVMVWKGDLGDFTTVRDSVYNSSKGKQCADLTTAEKVDLVSCWDMDEASGDFEDSIASNDLTRTNGPTQARGLIISGDGDPDLYLTEVNVPTATGGALGYAARFAGASNQYAYTANGFPQAGDQDFGVCAWVRRDNAAAAAPYILSGYQANYSFRLNSTTTYGYTFVTYRTGPAINATATTVAPNSTNLSRDFVCGWYDKTGPTAGTAYVSHNDGSEGSGSHSGFVNHISGGINIARLHASGASDWDGEIGPVYFWDGALPSAAVRTSLYNSGKGKTCADLTTDEQVGMDYCWDMDEDGGPYESSLTANTLTAGNTPTQAAGMVERSDSGMGVNLTNSPYFSYDGAALKPGDGDFSFVYWVNEQSATYDGHISRYGGAGSYSYLCIQDASSVYMVMSADGTNTTDGNAKKIAIGAGWHMISCQYDATNDLMSWSVDAGTPATESHSGGAYNTGTEFRVGSYASGHFSGQMDNVAYWEGKFLSQAELDGLYDAGAGDFYSAYWDFVFEKPWFAWSKPPETRRLYAVH